MFFFQMFFEFFNNLRQSSSRITSWWMARRIFATGMWKRMVTRRDGCDHETYVLPKKGLTAWNLKHPFINGCFHWMIPNLYIGNGCFTKHLFIYGCLGFQAEIWFFGWWHFIEENLTMMFWIFWRSFSEPWTWQMLVLGRVFDFAWCDCNMGVSQNSGTSKWMVYNGKPYENGWFGGTPIFGNTHILILQYFAHPDFYHPNCFSEFWSVRKRWTLVEDPCDIQPQMGLCTCHVVNKYGYRIPLKNEGNIGYDP